MAVLGRVLFSSAERVDLPDLISIDSYAAGDWRYFLQSFVGSSKPYILTGFEVINPSAAIGTSSCSIKVADSVVYYPGSAAGPFFYGLSEGNSNSAPLIPQLRTNAVNYVYLTLTTFNTASDTRALWDPDRDNGTGAEFTQDVNTESVIQAQVNVSTGSFPVNTVPIAIVTMGSSVILSIQDARDMLFRLGTGGLNPDPLNRYSFRALPASQYARNEPNTTTSKAGEANPFQGGDKNIQTMKEWMDLVMTKLRELGGTKYWYEDTSTFNIINMFHDALTTSWKSKGTYTHSSTLPGQLAWTEDIYIKSVSSPKDIVVRASGLSPLNIDNEQIAFIKLIRNQPINTLDMPVAFVNGQAFVNTVNGLVGLFQNLKKGDWIKKASDSDVLLLQVREFYNTTQSPGSISGSPTSAASARSIVLSGPYQGTTSQPGGERARYDRGEYTTTDIQIVNRNDPSLTLAGGDELWFAIRSDTILPLSTIASKGVSGSVSFADGTGITVSATNHGMIDGDRITVVTPVEHAGTYSVDVIDNATFVIKSTNKTTGSFTGFYGLATTTSTSVDGFQLESENHGLDSGESVVISGTNNFDGSYIVNVRSSTQFQFPLSSSRATELSVGKMALARMDVRSEEGIHKLVQGETIHIGSSITDNLRKFIGMTSQDQIVPVYSIPTNYNTINTGANYNTLITDDLTARLSKATAMLMNKAQDKNIKFLTSAVEATNTASGSNRQLSFVPSGSTLTIIQPGSPGNASFVLPSTGTPLTLAVNQCAYVTINRNASTNPVITISSISACPIDENVFVIAARLSDERVYLWNGEAVLTTVPLAPSDPALISVTCHDPVSNIKPTGNPVIIDGRTLNAGDTVLFTKSGSGSIYKAQGVGTNITGWDLASYSFHDSQTPIQGDSVIVRSGTAFGLQVGRFDGTQWVFNDKVRYFNGTDYFEQSNIVSTAIVNNSAGTLITTAWQNNEHMIIDYSVVRSTARETGTMQIVTDGAVASLVTSSSYVNGNTGVTFEARISGSNLIIEYVSTNTGASGTVKYMVRRWSSGTGGPAGIPSYSGAAPAPTAASGPVNSIQFNSGGFVTGNSNFIIDVVDLSLNYNGMRQVVLASASLNNNQTSFANLFTINGLTYPNAIVEYSVNKEGQARVGRFLIAYNGATVGFNDQNVETGATGVTFQAIKSGNNIQIQYTTTNATGLGTFKYSLRKWA